MASISNISESFCDWRSHIDAGDGIQAYDGRGWYAATIYRANGTDNDELYIGYDNYSSQYDFHCGRQSKRIRPTIGFLRKKIMVPQAEKIKELDVTNNSLRTENEKLRQQLASYKNKFDIENYKYLAVKKLSSRDLAHLDDTAELKVDGQEEIESILMQNVRVLSKWNKITKELDALNEELNETEKQTESTLGIKDLVRIQVMMDKRIEIQRQRLESQQNNVLIPVMKQKFKIDGEINKYREILQNKKSLYGDKLDSYDNIYKDCEQLIGSLNDLILYCNQKIAEENEMNKDQMSIQMELYETGTNLASFEEYGLSFFDLLKGFQKFEILNKHYISNSTQKLNAGWKCIESSWYEWQCDDLLLWIQHKMGWLNTSKSPKYLDFDDILENMQFMQINGASLVNLKKVDLSNAGFKIYAHRTKIYQLIKSLITKYKQPEATEEAANNDENSTADIDCNDNDENDSDFEEEEGATTRGDDDDSDEEVIDIPDKYRCALTDELMSNPVICGHNNKIFEKSAIYEYIQENGHLPQSKEASLNQINVTDVSSYLLFDDLSLKVEIEQFKQQNQIRSHQP